MSSNLVDKTTGELVTLASGTRMWIGSKNAHDTVVAQGKMPNNVMVCITDDYKEEEEYSTEETKTNKVWIDGKPIYRKVIDCGTLPSTTQKTVNTGITNADKLVHLYGTCSSANNFLPLPYTNTDGNNVQLWLSDNFATLNIRTISTSWINYTGYAILEYTKSGN